MADSKLVEKPLLEKIQDLLARKPEHCDVVFCVGKKKKIVRALKVILIASSPFLEKEFEEKWEFAVFKEGDGILLPDFDPIAFELFVKLTSLDSWSLEILKTLKMSLLQILNLLSICRGFEMTKSVKNLEELAATLMQSFGKYKDTDDFLQLSQTNLKSVLGCDDIGGIKELDVFHSALRWAEFQCKEIKVEPTEEHIREVLGDCLFEIRFPIMTCSEFTKAAESKEILTAEEIIGIYKFIGSEDSKRLEFNTKKLSFKTTQRKKPLFPPGISRLCLTEDGGFFRTSFVCDGTQKYHLFAPEKKVTVHGLGFLGPIENDGFFDVKVQIVGQGGITYDSGMLWKRVFAEKDKKFYFIFDEPMDLEAGDVSGSWSKHFKIKYHLIGAKTSSDIRLFFSNTVFQEGDTKFRLQWHSYQLAEILFNSN